MNKKTFFSGDTIIFFCLIAMLFVMMITTIKYLPNTSEEKVIVSGATDRVQRVAELSNIQGLEIIDVLCDTDSMGLTIDCSHTIYGKKVLPKEQLRRGGIYVYDDGRENVRTIHRLVACYKIIEEILVNDVFCSETLIFKGDNNYYADDPISRDKVLYKVIYIGGLS
jgi:hypothetical protein